MISPPHPNGLQNILPDTILGLQPTTKSTAAGALPRTPLGELIRAYSASPELLAGETAGRGYPPSPQESYLPLWPFGSQALALRSSPSLRPPSPKHLDPPLDQVQ